MSGSWVFKNNSLQTSTTQNCNIRLPLATDRAYRLEVQAKRTEGTPASFFINIPAFGNYAAIQLDAGGAEQKQTGLSMIDGKRFNENGTGCLRIVFNEGEVVEITVDVQRNHITVAVDGSTVVNWQGDLSRLGYPGDAKDNLKNRTGLGANTA